MTILGEEQRGPAGAMEGAAEEQREERTWSKDARRCPVRGPQGAGAGGALAPRAGGVPLGVGCLLEEEGKEYGSARGSARLTFWSGAAKWRCQGG